jgi:hypothetical protein
MSSWASSRASRSICAGLEGARARDGGQSVAACGSEAPFLASAFCARAGAAPPLLLVRASRATRAPPPPPPLSLSHLALLLLELSRHELDRRGLLLRVPDHAQRELRLLHVKGPRLVRAALPLVHLLPPEQRHRLLLDRRLLRRRPRHRELALELHHLPVDGRDFGVEFGHFCIQPAHVPVNVGRGRSGRRRLRLAKEAVHGGRRVGRARGVAGEKQS